IFHHEGFTTVEGADVRVEALLQIGGVYTVCPTIADLGLERSPGEVEPRLVEVGALLVGARNPGEERQAIRHQSEQPVAVAVQRSTEAHMASLVDVARKPRESTGCDGAVLGAHLLELIPGVWVLEAVGRGAADREER